MAAERERKKPYLLGLPPQEEARRKLLREALRYVLPTPQADEAVEAMMGVFGSFSAVFSAPMAELVRVPGVGQECANFLRLTMDLAKACMEDQAEGLKRIFDTPSAVDAFRPKFLGRKTEAVCLMLLDGRGRLIYNGIFSEGSVSEVPVYIRRLVQLCIEYDAQCVMLAHNHPSGNAMPSRNDIVATRQIEMALESIDAELRDHIIFAGNDFYSFESGGLLSLGRETVREYRYGALEAARRAEQEFLENQ